MGKKKNIYSYDIKWGNIPIDQNKIAFHKWQKTFRKKNKLLILNINNLSEILVNSFNENFQNVLSDTKITDAEKKEALRIAKYCFNHLGRFKNIKTLDQFQNIIKNPWLLNLRPLRAYPQVVPDLIKVISNNKNNSYLLLNSIWLLGEIRDKDALRIIADTFINTLDSNNKKLILLNCISAEALLKINNWNNFDFDGILKILKNWINTKQQPNYKLVRNVFLILNNGKKLSDFDKTIQSASILWKDNSKIITFINWFEEVEEPNVIDNFDYVTEEVKRKYPLTEPEPHNYQS